MKIESRVLSLLKGFDRYVFMQLHSIVSRYSRLKNATVLITNLSSKLFYVTYSLSILFLIFAGDKRIIPFMVGPAAGFIIARGVRHIGKRERPYITLKVNPLIPHAKNSSFPSLHTFSAFVIAMSTWYISSPIGGVMLLLAGITGLSRVMVGVHYPLDVLVGSAVGILTSVGTFAVFFNF